MFRLLDLFCGAGGCTAGYQKAGFWVRGVDIKPQPRYCGEEFVQASALEYLAGLITSGEIQEFDGVHASPPCQGYSENMKHLSDGSAPLLIEPCRELLNSTGLPWVIENVEGAPLETSSNLFGDHGVILCGTQFGLRVWRHRLFESSFAIPSAGACKHDSEPFNPHNVVGRKRMRAEVGSGNLEKIWGVAMGVEWMNQRETRQAIPPAYTEYVGRQMLDAIRRSRERDGGAGGRQRQRSPVSTPAARSIARTPSLPRAAARSRPHPGHVHSSDEEWPDDDVYRGEGDLEC